MNRFSIAAVLALTVLPLRARADVPPYQPTEDACDGLSQGASCNVNLDFNNFNTQGQGYADGGSGTCQHGGLCTVQITLPLLPDGGEPSDPDAGISCVEGTKCDEQTECLQCVVPDGGVPAGTSTTSGSTSAGGSTGTTGSTTTTGSSGSTGASGTTGSSGGCSSAAAVGPWILALLIPVLVRRKKQA